MQRILFGALSLAILSSIGCQGQAGTPNLDTDDRKASYGIGLQMGESLGPAEARLDMDAFMAGLRDGMSGAEPALDQNEIIIAVQQFSEGINAEMQAQREAEAQENAQAGEAYLAVNAQKEGVTTTESGLQYEVLTQGEGPLPGPEDRVRIHYEGRLLDGTIFDSSRQRGEPATFGLNGVIPGFGEGLQLMPVGSTYRFVIPGELAYGRAGASDTIGPNATLIFEVELLEIVEADAPSGS